VRLPRTVLGLGVLAACCSSPPPCPPIPELWPAAGTGTPSMGMLVPLAEEQSLTIAPTHDYAEYRFKRAGISYTARYALGREPPPYALPFVFVQRPQPLPPCAALAGHGPTIDAIDIRRGGSVVSTGQDSSASRGDCPGQGLTKPSPLDGPPDGQGASLADAAHFSWRLAGKLTLQTGDQVTVTVLDSAAEPFEVFAGSQQAQATLKLGALSGSGTVLVP
jgi:hypothetical protein